MVWYGMAWHGMAMETESNRIAFDSGHMAFLSEKWIYIKSKVTGTRAPLMYETKRYGRFQFLFLVRMDYTPVQPLNNRNMDNKLVPNFLRVRKSLRQTFIWIGCAWPFTHKPSIDLSLFQHWKELTCFVIFILMKSHLLQKNEFDIMFQVAHQYIHIDIFLFSMFFFSPFTNSYIFGPIPLS